MNCSAKSTLTQRCCSARIWLKLYILHANKAQGTPTGGYFARNSSVDFVDFFATLKKAGSRDPVFAFKGWFCL